MHSSGIDAINKLNITVSDSVFEDKSALRILWLSAFCTDNKDSLNYRPHNHTFFEVHFITQGSIRYRFDENEADGVAGNYILIPPHCIHCIMDQSEDFHKITLSFEVNEYSDVFYSLCDMTKRAVEISEDILTSLDFIVRHASSKSPYVVPIIKTRLEEVIFMMASSSSHRPMNLSSGEVYDPRLLKAKKFIEDNPHIFLTCDEVAQCCRLSAKQLGRLFQQYENCSLLSFIHGQKIEAAKKMIRETDELFELISEKLGFSSVNYFGKFFIRCTGMTPGDYRRSHRTKKT